MTVPVMSGRSGGRVPVRIETLDRPWGWRHNPGDFPAGLCYSPVMKIVITGGGGFLGYQLAVRLQGLGELHDAEGQVREIDEICLFDRFFPEVVKKGAGGVITMKEGDISDPIEVRSAVDRDDISIFHLASMVSGECEKQFDDALKVNLMGGWHVFEAARERTGTPKVVFASSIACFGGEVMPETMDDTTKRTPQTTYGMTKVIGELMVNDFTRKGYLDGRSARLPTVIIRPGKPNAAASSWASGMFREPLNGETCHLPVRRDQRHPMTGYREVIDSFVALHEIPSEKFGDDRALQLPAHSVSPNDAASALREIAEETGRRVGEIVDAFDPGIQGIVDQWPTAVDGSRAVELGLPSVPPLKRIVEDYVEDFLDEKG